MKRKAMALLLVLAMTATLFAGCGKKDSDSGSQTGGNTGTTDGSTNTEDGNAGQEPAEWSWPLAEQKTLKVWKSWDGQGWTDSPEELLANQLMEEELNVNIEWVSPAPVEASEKFGLMMASGDFPDIIFSVDQYYTGGIVQACEDGVVVDLSDYIPMYMPNYEALRSSNESLIRDTKTDDGRSIAPYTINTKDGVVAGEQPWSGLCLRQDWLNELNLEVPTTVDEWYTVLTAFKEQKNCEAPLLLGSDDALDMGQDFLTAFGVCKDFYQVDGVVKYGPLQDGYRQWIELFRQWYAEGLIDQNFVSNNALYYSPFEYIGTGRAGAGANLYSWTCDYLISMGIATDPDYWLVAAPSPVLNEGDTPQLAINMGNLTGAALCVSTNCKDIELACRWLDYWYTTDGMLRSSYGIEGESYKKLDDGSYEFSGNLISLVESGEYPTLAEGLKAEYCLHNEAFGMYNWYALSVIRKGDPVLAAYDVWDVAKTDMVLPSRMSMTTEELNEHNNLYVSLQTLVRENTIKFITGTQSMDAYEQFQSDLISYGADKCIQFQQAALDRYNAR